MSHDKERKVTVMPIYSFDELSDEAKAYALEDYRRESESYLDSLEAIDWGLMSDFNELLEELYCHTDKSVEPRIDGTMTVTPTLRMDDDLWEQNAVEHDAIGGHIPDVPVLRDSRYYNGTAKQALITTWNGQVPELQKIVDSINAEADAIADDASGGRPDAFDFNESEVASDALEANTNDLKDELYSGWEKAATLALNAAVAALGEVLLDYASDDNVIWHINEDGIMFSEDGTME